MSHFQIEDRFLDLLSMLFQDVQLPQVLGTKQNLVCVSAHDAIFGPITILIHQQKFSVVFEIDDGSRVHGLLDFSLHEASSLMEWVEVGL